MAVQCSADTFVVNQNWFSASTFVVKIATFAKPETVISKPKGRPCNHQTDTKTTKLSGDNNSVDNFAVTPYRPDLFADTQANAFVLKISPPHILKNNFSQHTLAHLGFAPSHKPTQANPKRANYPPHQMIFVIF